MVEKLNFSSIVWREENLYVAWCPDLDIASQGKSIEESLDNLKEAIELYLEDEDATIPKKKTTTIVTTVSVETRAKTTSHLRQRSS
ncbi:MAG: type II toxin-antitoxin system HicB family antitoxin [Candidatus Bathyarchaeia archaeon]|nr:type II toxin-antitoxin system HicB family antitoxin [Candidatus Bathyarchaeia archaeon]